MILYTFTRIMNSLIYSNDVMHNLNLENGMNIATEIKVQNLDHPWLECSSCLLDARL